MTEPLDLVILAGDRGPDDPLCRAAGVPAKALVQVGDRAVLERVIDSLDAAFPAAVAPTRLVSGPAAAALEAVPHAAARLVDRLAAGGWRRLEPAGSPASSALAALRETDPRRVTLLTTGDHALLTAPLAQTFHTAALARQRDGADLAVAFVPLTRVQARFPGARRTALRFSDGEVCTCNLFALLTPAAHRVIDLWRQVEQDRKRPWRMVRRLGPLVLVRFLLRRVTLSEALARLGQLAGAHIEPVLLDEPEAAVDVDSIADWELVQAVVADRERAAPAKPACPPAEPLLP